MHQPDKQQCVTSLLERCNRRQPRALDDLIEHTYDQLRRIGQQRIRGERRSTLDTTALVNETYMRLTALERIEWRDREHFFAVAAGVMRRVLVDHARSRGAKKRGCETLRVTWNDDLVGDNEVVDTLALDDALTRLSRRDPMQAHVVELRFFGGLTVDEIAQVLDVGSATVKRRWTLAQAWLFRELREQ